jgi:hypothetical protein
MLSEKMKKLFVLTLLFSTLNVWAVDEIPDTSVNDIAITTMRNGQMAKW